MKVIKPYYEIMTPIDGDEILRFIEKVGRVAYKSEHKITDKSARPFVKSLIERGHESVLEHRSFTVRFVVDRAVSHELVRHRLASYTQESTRYVTYSDGAFGREITFIQPCFWTSDLMMQRLWLDVMEKAELIYEAMIEFGAKPQEARSVLPNSLKTEVIMTANLREWRHFFKLRTAPATHPQMREVTIPLLKELKESIPVIFDDIEVKE